MKFKTYSVAWVLIILLIILALCVALPFLATAASPNKLNTVDIRLVLAEVGLNAVALLGACFGSLLIVTLNDKETSFRNGLAQIIAGLCVGGYGTEFLTNYLKWQPATSTCGLMGFVLGLGGLFIARAFITIFKRIEANPLEICRNFFSNFLKKDKDAPGN